MSTPVIAPDTAPPALRRRGWWSPERIIEFAMLGVLVVLVIVATVLYPGFLSLGNLQIMATQFAPLGVIAVGMTLVIIAGGFDLSVGSIFAVSATTATALWDQLGPFAMVLGILLATLLGALNGFIITMLKVNPFITTLGTMSLYSGAVLYITNSTPFSNTEDAFRWLGRGTILGIPTMIVILVLVFLLGTLLLNSTRFGRSVFAIGGSREAARLTGIPVRRVQATTYVISGFLAGVAGVMTASQIGAGQGTMGTGMELNAIAVVVIGGTSLVGGEGRVWRTAVGLAVLATLDNIFYSLAVNSNAQLIVKGAIIILAVAADQLVRARRR